MVSDWKGKINMVTVSAPGKIMLFGEHAVVYGQPCIVTAVNERLHVSVEPAAALSFDTPHTNDTRFLEAAVHTAKKLFSLNDLAVKITTHNGFSSVKGFGSSSAVTVATIAAMAQYTHHTISDRELFDAAYTTVLSVQGVGSGFDVAAATYGGTLLFTKGGETLSPLVLPSSLPLVIGYSGVKADTAALIRAVEQRMNNQPEEISPLLSSIGSLVKEASVVLQRGEWETVGRLMNKNQEYLQSLGVSSIVLDELIAASLAAGAYGAKLSGAGGGDCMIALVPPQNRLGVEQAIRKAGGEVVSIIANAPGVKTDTETTDDLQELFVVVDTEDEIVGYKTREDCHKSPSVIHRSVGVLICDPEGRVLLQKRSKTKDTRPGYWSTSVGGHVMKGESYQAAARREAKEELGIDIEGEFVGKKVNEYTNEKEMNAVFLATHAGPFFINKEEVAEVRFFSKDELLQLFHDPSFLLSESARYDLRAAHIL
jgi:mevalonate kinase